MNDSAENSAGLPSLSYGNRAPAPAATALRANPYDAFADEPQHDLRATILHYLGIVIRRRWLVLGITMGGVAIGVTSALMQTPLYTAAVRIQIDRSAAQVVDTGNVAPADVGDTESLRTQFEILKSRGIAERTASTVKAAEDFEFLKPTSFSIIGALRSAATGSSSVNIEELDAATRTRMATDIVGSNVNIRPVPGSRLADISYVDRSPVRAAKIANAFADSYIDQTIDKRFQSNAYAKTFLEDQSKQLQIRLQESEQALLKFSEDHQIIILSEKSTIAENNLSAASAALSVIVSERIRNEQIWRQVDEASNIELPQFLSNSVVQQLRANRQALETEYQEKLETFKPSYPAMVEISNKIKEVDRQLAVEVRTIKTSLKGAYEASRQQERETNAQIETLRAEVLDLQKKLIQYNILKREVDTNRSLYNGLLQRLKEVEVAGGVGTNNVFIVDRARAPSTPSSPRLARALILWLALGLGAGFGAAYLIEMLDDTIRTQEELERISGLATLGVIPKVSSDNLIENEVIDPRSALSEAYRSFCTSLQFSTEQGLPKTLLFTSSGPAEGKSITSIAVARHFATMGLKVLLIDADLRNPSLHTKLQLSNGMGLSNYLTGAKTPPEVMQSTDVENFIFIATGPLPPNAADLLSSARLHSLLSVGLEVFDLIVLDGPPVMGLADAQILSNAASATVFVVGARQAKSRAVSASLRRLELARAPLIGTLLTKYDAKDSGYGYGYGYGSDYQYGRPADVDYERNPALADDRKSA